MTGGLSDQEIRNINLIEILLEEAEEQGHDVPEPPTEAKRWTEDDIREYFNSKGTKLPSSTTHVLPPTTTTSLSTATSSILASRPRLQPPSEEAFRSWFPGLTLSKTACEAPKLRVLCFANAGNAEDMYTNEGTGIRRAPSPLLEWCRSNGAECLAPQYPGRAMRIKEPKVIRAADLAAQILPVVASRLYGIPYVVVAHSVGTWIAYEFLRAAEAAGVPPPHAYFLSGMPSPDIPMDQRPWRQQRHLQEDDFKEECKGWDISDIVFTPAMWPTYQPLLRADFTLFDEYTHQHEGQPPFTFPLYGFWGTRDRRVKEHHVRGWAKFSSCSSGGGGSGDGFECVAVEGNHLWPLDKEAKATWLQCIVDKLQELFG